MKKKNKHNKFMAFLMALVLLGTTMMPTTALAADLEPYGYVWDDAAGVTHYQYFVFKDGAYRVAQRVITVGDTLFQDGKEIFSDVKTGKGFIGYDESGNLWVVTEAGTVKSLSAAGKKATYKAETYKKLVLDADGLVTAVQNSKGKEVKLNKLTTSTTTPTPTPTPTPSSKNDWVDRTGGADQTVKAYDDGKLKVQLYVKDGSVLEELVQVYLSSTCKGAKFLGIDKEFSTYLYETGGILYKFTYGEWYSAKKLEVEGELKDFDNDSKGFLTEIITTKKTYKVDAEDTSFKAGKTYAVAKADYVTLYVQGQEETHTLQYKDDILYLDGKVISANVTKYGFVDKQTYVYVTKEGHAYTGTIGKTGSKYQRSNVTDIVTADGLVTHIKCGTTKYKLK